MTSLSRRRETAPETSGSTTDVDTNLRLADPETKTDEIIKISVLDKDYFFSPEHVRKYPKLLDPDARFLLSFDSVLPLIYGYGPSALDQKLLDEPHEKQRFLLTLEFLEIELNNDLILHICSSLRKEVSDLSDLVRRRTGKKGTKKIRIDQDQEIVSYACQHDQVFRQSGADILPLDILRYLATGTGSLLDSIVIADFKSKNLISGFIKSFHEHLVAQGD